MYEDSRSKISQLEKILDAKEDLVTKRVKRHTLLDKENIVNQVWDDSEFETKEVGAEMFRPQKKGSSFPMKILIYSVIFFVLALGIMLYKFMGGGNIVSSNNIEINVKAPVSITGGEVFSFELEIKNNNNTALTASDLTITFPLGAKEVSDSGLPAKTAQIFLGNILPNQTIKRNMSVVLFGEENVKKEIGIGLEYKIAGSNSLFNKTKNVSVLISSSPVNIIVTGPKEINTNQNVEFSVEITSNSPSMIKGLLLKADYPFGFVFSDSNPKTFSKNNLWLIGDLEPGAKRTIKFSGVLGGQEGEERGFNFSTGSQAKNDNLSIDVPFSTAFSSVTIRRPFVSADVLFNGQDVSEYVSNAGEKIETQINWQNNLPYEVSDVSVEVTINGNILDKSSVKASDGFYQSVNNTLVFNKTTNPILARLESGKAGTSKFAFNSFGAGSVTGLGINNPVITMNISVKGHRVDYLPGQEDVFFTDTRKIKIASAPQLFAKALYYVGNIENIGPLPPKVDQATTYTINWTITNPLNNLSNVQVSATLPPHVSWVGVISPATEKIDYKADTSLLVWNAGNISAGAGSVSPAKEVSFQVSLLPSVEQIGQVASLIGEASLSAKDNFTLTTISGSSPALNTTLSNDPYYKIETDKVVK
jgi:hypothetical protein